MSGIWWLFVNYLIYETCTYSIFFTSKIFFKDRLIVKQVDKVISILYFFCVDTQFPYKNYKFYAVLTHFVVCNIWILCVIEEWNIFTPFPVNNENISYFALEVIREKISHSLNQWMQIPMNKYWLINDRIKIFL